MKVLISRLSWQWNNRFLELHVVLILHFFDLFQTSVCKVDKMSGSRFLDQIRDSHKKFWVHNPGNFVGIRFFIAEYIATSIRGTRRRNYTYAVVAL